MILDERDIAFTLENRTRQPWAEKNLEIPPSVLSPKYEVFCRRFRRGGFFKARAKCPYLSHTGRSAAAEEKQPNGPGPKGCDENGPAAALLVGHVWIQICSLLVPCRRPILIVTKYLVFRGRDTSAEEEEWAEWSRFLRTQGEAV
jgi:hypothetical protein